MPGKTGLYDGRTQLHFKGEQYVINMNLLDVPFSECKVLQTVSPPEWERMASKQGMIVAKIGGQKEHAPTIGSIGPEKQGKGKGGRGPSIQLDHVPVCIQGVDVDH